MSRTLTALFDTRADAEAGRTRLTAAGVHADNIQIHDQDSMGSSMSSGQSYSTHNDRGVWNNTKNAFLPDEDRHTYEEGIRRGGFLLTADIDGDDAGRAVEALENSQSVDIDERAGQWRQQGWDYKSSAATGAAAGGAAYAASQTADMTTRGTTTGTATGNVAGEERIQLAEEQLVVGKREVQHGGVRVRSYVTERPVQEQIRLREEHVNIERRPVTGGTVGNADALFQERSIDMQATAEEAVVGKTARVTEELVINKTADTRVETINETVRKTEVEIDETGGRTDTGYTGTSGSTTGTTGAGVAGAAAGAASGVANKAAGLGQEALGNVKQAVGGLTGNESLRQSGQAQERAGEARQGKLSD